jgi:hypothetical protein
MSQELEKGETNREKRSQVGPGSNEEIAGDKRFEIIIRMPFERPGG